MWICFRWCNFAEKKKCQADIDVMQSHRLRMGEVLHVRVVMREVFHARYSCNFSIYWLIKIVGELLCEGGGPMHK